MNRESEALASELNFRREGRRIAMDTAPQGMEKGVNGFNAYEEGRNACKAGKALITNPYTSGTAQFNRWVEGYKWWQTWGRSLAKDGVRDIAIGVRENGKWYYEVKGMPKVGPFASVEEAKKAAIAKGYDW